jgi:DNA-binding HxlR family transcriptional regulator
MKDLRELALIELGDNGFTLTDLGMALVGKLASLDSWANDWADQLAHRQQLK